MSKNKQNQDQESQPEPFSQLIYMKNYDDNEQDKNQQKKPPTFHELPIQQSQSQNDILQQIQDILERDVDQEKMTKKEMLLNFKVNQLHKICQTLSDANKKLTDKLQYLSSSNDKTERSQNSQSAVFTDQLTQMQGQFTQIQALLMQYKNQLKKSQEKWNAIRQQKDEEISQLKKQLIIVQQRNQQLQIRIKEKQQDISALQNRNEELLVQIQNLEIQREEISARDSRSYSKPGNMNLNNYDLKFNQRIEAQLESMVQKLLKELSHEKKLNSRMTMQIKRLNNQILDLQKSIKLKNQNLYQLQLRLIRSSKSQKVNYMNWPQQNYTPKRPHNKGSIHQNQNQNQPVHYRRNIKDQIVNINIRPQYPNNQKYYLQEEYIQDQVNYLQTESLQSEQFGNKIHHNNQHAQQHLKKRPINQKNRSISGNILRKNESSSIPRIKNNNLNMNLLQDHQQEQKRKFLQFTLMDLQNGQIKIKTKQKVMIASKLILIYCKKIKTKNYYNLIAEEIQIYNYNSNHPNLLRVRAINSSNRSNLQKQSQESLLWNMAFIIQTLLNQVQSQDSSSIIDLNLSQVIEQILSQTVQEKISYFQQLSKSLEASIK